MTKLPETIEIQKAVQNYVIAQNRTKTKLA